MQADGELKDLRNRENRARQAIIKLASEVCLILADDLLKYPAREVRRRFVAEPLFAESMDDATVQRLKAELDERSVPVRDGIMEHLNADDRWLAGLEYEGQGKSFAENEKLWTPTAAAAELVREILTAYDFPRTEPPPAEYRMPTWFINGKYLPGMAEKYWGIIGEIREIRTRIREVEDGAQRETLGKRWDSL